MTSASYAIAAADHGSFYRAARRLGVEQSTLSRAILKLERLIGMPIFERSHTRVTMTLAGNAFIRGAKPMVATADKLVAMMRAAGQGRAGGLVLGHNSSVSAGNFRATLMSWHEAHPDVDLECVEVGRDDIRISGSRAKLLGTLAGAGLASPGVFKMATEVRSFEPKWLPGPDSNQRPSG